MDATIAIAAGVAASSSGVGGMEGLPNLESAKRQDDTPVPRQPKLRDLMTAILDQHHAYLKRELPAIEALLAEIARGEPGSYRQTAAELLPLFRRFRPETEAHMKREEMTLFPLIDELESAIGEGRPAPRHSFGPLRNPIQFMNEDHDFENQLLGRMAEISRKFACPPGAPRRYEVLMSRLQALALDLREHVRKEDEILFPAAIRLEEGSF